MMTKLQRIYVSFKKMEVAFNQVREELRGMGLLFTGSPLDKVDCYHERFSLGALSGFVGVMGFYDFSDRNIHIPMAYPAGLFPRWFSKRQMLDVLRHEFGHALAHRYPEALRNGDLFKKAFGGPYGVRPAKGTDPDDWEGRCVTGYAATRTREDFAETFMLFVKHKGKIPARFAKRPAIRKKWRAVEEIVSRAAASSR